MVFACAISSPSASHSAPEESQSYVMIYDRAGGMNAEAL